MIRKIGTVITIIIILINASCVYSETNKAFMKPEEVQEYMKSHTKKETAAYFHIPLTTFYRLLKRAEEYKIREDQCLY